MHKVVYYLKQCYIESHISPYKESSCTAKMAALYCIETKAAPISISRSEGYLHCHERDPSSTESISMNTPDCCSTIFHFSRSSRNKQIIFLPSDNIASHSFSFQPHEERSNLLQFTHFTILRCQTFQIYWSCMQFKRFLVVTIIFNFVISLMKMVPWLYYSSVIKVKWHFIGHQGIRNLIQSVIHQKLPKDSFPHSLMSKDNYYCGE